MNSPPSVREASDTVVEAPPDVVPAALLDLWTQLANDAVEGPGTWSVTIFPDVGEATAAEIAPVADTGESSWSMLDDDQRQELNIARAQRRARKNLRQYSVQNQLSVLYTLTYACTTCRNLEGCVCGLASQPASRAEVRGHVNRFMTRVRAAMGLGSFAYVYVVERGSRGTKRLHVHLLLRRGFDVNLLELWWQHGSVDESFRASGTTGRENARRAAAYAAKYVGKSLADDDPAWAHSYERAQGHNVRKVNVRCRDMWDGLKLAAGILGGLVEVSRSLDWEDYYGPPAWSMFSST
jgi:hypothetical protein